MSLSQNISNNFIAHEEPFILVVFEREMNNKKSLYSRVTLYGMKIKSKYYKTVHPTPILEDLSC